MPVTLPVPTKNPGDLLTSALWNGAVRDNLAKLLERGHRVLTVAQFAALTGLEGTKGTVAPDEVYLEVDAANGIVWHLAYESGETTYKWRFLGGPPLFAEVAAAEGHSSATYAALATAGPAVGLPRAGDYDVEVGALVSGATGAVFGVMSYDIGATGAVDADGAFGAGYIGTTNVSLTMQRTRRKPALTTVTLTAKYKNATAAALNYQQRSMTVTPIRIRHDA